MGNVLEHTSLIHMEVNHITGKLQVMEVSLSLAANLMAESVRMQDESIMHRRR